MARSTGMAAVIGPPIPWGPDVFDDAVQPAARDPGARGSPRGRGIARSGRAALRDGLRRSAGARDRDRRRDHERRDLVAPPLQRTRHSPRLLGHRLQRRRDDGGNDVRPVRPARATRLRRHPKPARHGRPRTSARREAARRTHRVLRRAPRNRRPGPARREHRTPRARRLGHDAVVPRHSRAHDREPVDPSPTARDLARRRRPSRSCDCHLRHGRHDSRGARGHRLRADLRVDCQVRLGAASGRCRTARP
jgi:hypothetical protein